MGALGLSCATRHLRDSQTQLLGCRPILCVWGLYAVVAWLKSFQSSLRSYRSAEHLVGIHMEYTLVTKLSLLPTSQILVLKFFDNPKWSRN